MLRIIYTWQRQAPLGNHNIHDTLEEGLPRTSPKVDECNCNKFRIDALEASNKKIEYILHRLCENLGQNASDQDIDLRISATNDTNMGAEKAENKGKGIGISH
jgi:hypothetical protein